MNLVLFDPAEIKRPLPRSDERARHITTVLKRSSGDTFDVGLVNGPRGKAWIAATSESSLSLEFTWSAAHAPPLTTKLGVGFPRPQTGRDILRDATTLGATELAFLQTARSDPNYASSSLWTGGEWERHLRVGAAQAFDTFVPPTSWTHTLGEALADWSGQHLSLWALDVYGNHPHLATVQLDAPDQPLGVLIGPERGWDHADREIMAQYGVPFCSLGERVLRTESAVTATLSLLAAARVRAGKSPR